MDHATPLCDFDLSDASTSTSSPHVQANHRFQSGASGYQLEAVRLDMGASNIFVQLRSLGHDVRWLGLRGLERTMHSVLLHVACWRLNSSIGARFYPPHHTHSTHSHTTTATHHHDHPPPPTHTPNQPTPPPPLCLAAWSLFWVCLGTLLVLLLRLPIVPLRRRYCCTPSATMFTLESCSWFCCQQGLPGSVGGRWFLGSSGSSSFWEKG